MKTEQLIDLLAKGAGPAPRALVARRLAPVLAAALLASALASLAMLGPIPSSMWGGSAPWIKLAYAGALAAAGAWLVARLARPAMPIAAPAVSLVAVAGAMWFAGATALLAAPAADRFADLTGHSAARCPWAIVLLALPALFGIVQTLRALAPTRLRLAGFAAGLLAGAIGAAGYALSCTEESTAFIAVWYSAGIVLTGLLGGALGGRLLRW